MNTNISLLRFVNPAFLFFVNYSWILLNVEVTHLINLPCLSDSLSSGGYGVSILASITCNNALSLFTLIGEVWGSCPGVSLGNPDPVVPLFRHPKLGAWLGIH